MKKFITVWRIIYPASYSIILLCLAAYALIMNAQGRDFFIGVAIYGVSLSYILKTSITILAWCLIIWYSNRLILQVKEIDVPDDKFSRYVIQWVPRILSLIPLLIISVALFEAAKIIHTYKWGSLLVYTAVTLVIGILLIFFYMKRPAIAKKMGINFKQDNSRYSPQGGTIQSLMDSRATKIAVRAIIVVNSLLFMLFFLPVKWGFARMLQPATVVNCGFIFFTVIVSVFVLKFNIRRSPALFVVVFYIILASTCNDNSSIRTLNSSVKPGQRENIETNFRKWINLRIIKLQDTTRHPRRDSIYPIIIVATEGGGIRSASWTAQVLKKLSELDSGFMDHVFAISGVSGGGVGSVFYTAYYHDQANRALQSLKTPGKSFENAVSADFLSDLTAAFIFPDNIQRILPFPVESFNRNSKLEDSWGYAYHKNLETETMDQPFLDIWYKDGRFTHSIPNLFINGAVAETGQKAITSNLAIHSDSMKIFSDDVDVLGILGSDIPAKTAASLCARFPVITSGALLKENGTRPVGHIIDGGYKENSGIETAWQLILGLNPFIRKAELARKNKYRFPVYLLFIQNSTDGKSISDTVSVTRIVPDLNTIMPGFLNAWDRRTVLYKNITAKLFRDTLLNDRYKYFEYKINNEKGLLPLGWYLSDAARGNIQEQVNLIKPGEGILGHLSVAQHANH